MAEAVAMYTATKNKLEDKGVVLEKMSSGDLAVLQACIIAAALVNSVGEPA